MVELRKQDIQAKGKQNGRGYATYRRRAFEKEKESCNYRQNYNGSSYFGAYVSISRNTLHSTLVYQ